MESPNKKEMSPTQEIFMRGIFRVSETNNLEEARQKEWRFDGGYSVDDRDKKSTNYLIFKNSEERSQSEDDAARRCTICHQPLKYVNLIGVGGQTVQMGRDCTAKLQRFVETGEIAPENPAREIWDEQSEILINAAGGYEEHDPGADATSDADNDEGAQKRKKRKIIASMMTWLADHADDNQTPENIRYASRSYNNTGLLPSNQIARELGEYYKATRKFLPAEILNKNEFNKFNYHPHRILLRKVVSEGVIQDDIPQLKRVIEKGGEINAQRWERRQRQLLEQREQEEQKERETKGLERLYEQKRVEKIRREFEGRERKENETKTSQAVREQSERQQREKMRNPKEQRRFQGHERLEQLYANGTIEKEVFRDTAFVDRIRISKPYGENGMVFAHPDKSHRKNLCFFEIDKKGVIRVYELDQSPIYGTANTLKYFVTIGNPIKSNEKYYPDSVFDQVNSEIWDGEGVPPRSSPNALASRVNEILPADQTILHYSCAQVIMDPDTDEPIFMLKDGPVSLDQLLKDYKIVEVDTEVE